NETSRRLQSVAEFGSEPSLSARLIGWRYTLRILHDYPIVGSGLGTFPEAWIYYYPGGTAGIWKEAHNDYLQVAAETGIAGAAVFAWGLFRFLKRYLFRMPRVAPGEWAGDVHVHHGIAIGLLSILLHSMVDFSLQVAAIALLFVVLSAIMVGSKARHAGA
ncbi:MAG TPA: O-antigen ligase family protein, partial [Patescibacteria group bacterium]|nr:O-antigen ligase family protein [Patescibacteria group bacterium]